MDPLLTKRILRHMIRFSNLPVPKYAVVIGLTK